MKKFLIAFLPPLLLLLILSGIYFLPQHQQMQQSAISPHLPLGDCLGAWVGTKEQENSKERAVLAADTLFSKASYRNTQKRVPPIHVSIVYSGNDLNASIHRPERCLPAQGHFNLHGNLSNLNLDNGKKVTFTRLLSSTQLNNKNKDKITHINYYVFIGHRTIRSTHMGRTLQDIWERVAYGEVQRWAYYQISSYWGDVIDVSEKECDDNLRAFIQALTPQMVDWDAL